MYNVDEVCKILNITRWTLVNWYQWERISLKDGELTERVLPVPERIPNKPGRPRIWSDLQIEQLLTFQKSVIRGRNGKMGKVTNPKSRQKKEK